MKRKKFISLKSLNAALVAGMLLLPMLASAQDREDKPRPRPGDRPQGDRPSGQARPQGGQPRGDYFLMRFRSILTEEQGQSLRESIEAAREAISTYLHFGLPKSSVPMRELGKASGASGSDLPRLTRVAFF